MTLGIRTTPIEGLLVVDLVVNGDARGWFKENWQREKMVALGLPDFGPVQNNVAFNTARGSTRGIHTEPWDKFVSVANGRVFGAWVDMRAGDTFGAVFPVEIRSGHFQEGGGRYLSIVRDITDRRHAEEERRRHIWFLESLDRVNRAMQGTNDLQGFIDGVMDAVLDIFHCDRVTLYHHTGEQPDRWLVVVGSRERPGFAPQTSRPTARIRASALDWRTTPGLIR